MRTRLPRFLAVLQLAKAAHAGWQPPPTSADMPMPAALVRLVDYLLAEGELTSAKILAAVERSGVRGEDLKPWADFEHPAADSYGRKVRRHCSAQRFALPPSLRC